MKPNHQFKSNKKGTFIIFSVIPLGLSIMSIISYFMNQTVQIKQLFAMLGFILLLTIILFLFAWFISWRKIELFEDKIVIKKPFKKQVFFFNEVNKINESEVGGKFIQGKAKTICIETKSKEIVHIPSKTFEQSKKVIIQLIKKQLKVTKQKEKKKD